MSHTEPMPRQTVTYKGPHEAVRLPAGMLVDRPEDDGRPAHVVERGETISVEAEFAATLLESDSWGKGRGKALRTTTDDPSPEVDDEPDELEEPDPPASSTDPDSSEEG